MKKNTKKMIYQKDLTILKSDYVKNAKKSIGIKIVVLIAWYVLNIDIIYINNPKKLK